VGGGRQDNPSNAAGGVLRCKSGIIRAHRSAQTGHKGQQVAHGPRRCSFEFLPPDSRRLSSNISQFSVVLHKVRHRGRWICSRKMTAEYEKKPTRISGSRKRKNKIVSPEQTFALTKRERPKAHPLPPWKLDCYAFDGDLLATAFGVCRRRRRPGIDLPRHC